MSSLVDAQSQPAVEPGGGVTLLLLLWMELGQSLAPRRPTASRGMTMARLTLDGVCFDLEYSSTAFAPHVAADSRRWFELAVLCPSTPCDWVSAVPTQHAVTARADDDGLTGATRARLARSNLPPPPPPLSSPPSVTTFHLQHPTSPAHAPSIASHSSERLSSPLVQSIHLRLLRQSAPLPWRQPRRAGRPAALRTVTRTGTPTDTATVTRSLPLKWSLDRPKSTRRDQASDHTLHPLNPASTAPQLAAPPLHPTSH